MAGVTAILGEVQARLGNRSDVSARALVWLNDAYFELLCSPRFAFFELDATTTLTTVSGTRTYGLPAVIWFIQSVRDDTNIRRLHRAAPREFDEITHVAGQPTQYARFGATVELDPTPDGTYTLLVRYRTRPNELAVGGTHLLGREWDEVLTALAVLKGREALEQTDQAAAQRQLVEHLLATREEVLSLEDMDADTTIAPNLTASGWWR